jgi:phosphatidylglycerol:prolipoprotein diacylglycerol transferase
MLAYYTHDLSPFLIRFTENFGIRYYGLAYAVGFLLLYFGLRWQAQRDWSLLRGEAIGDFVTWLALAGVLLGGRLGYCLAYDFAHTLRDPVSVIAFWRAGGLSGMASHGGILGSILVMIFFARARGIPFYNLADATALVAPLTLGIGRIANFINGELWGRPSLVPWAVQFPQAPDGGTVPRHPSQLYQAGLEGFFLFAVLLMLRLKTKRDGVVSLSFCAGYAVLRIVGEQFREPDHQRFLFGPVTQGQFLSVLLLAAAGILAWRQLGPGRSGTKKSGKL